MIDNAKYTIALALIKRAVIPVLVGAVVGWLVANGYNHWADAVCSSSDALGISVKECN
jgi:hypothetical protein